MVAKRKPDTLEAQPARLDTYEPCRLTTKLRDQVVCYNRSYQFFGHHLDAFRKNILRIHRHLEVANIELHIVAMGIELGRTGRIDFKCRDQIQKAAIVKLDFVNRDLDLASG